MGSFLIPLMYGRRYGLFLEETQGRCLSTPPVCGNGIQGTIRNFISIQHSHGISCEGYQPAVVRTGYEQVMATRTSKTFAYTAKSDGKVISIKKDGIIVEYANGKRVGVKLGRVYGSASSLTFPFNIATPLVVGQSFKKGQVIAYNEQFFARDYLNPSGVVYKGSMPIMVALMENPATYEDSSSISQRLAERFITTLTHPVRLVVRVDQAIHEVVKPGQWVSSRDPLCILEDAVTAEKGLFDATVLAELGAQAPKAGVNGLVDSIDVRYNAELDDMSSSMRELAVAADKRLADRKKAVGETVLTNRIKESDGYRVSGNPLLEGTMEICFNINQRVSMAPGDKLVMGNQLKSIVGEVTPEPMTTESGVMVDMKFGSVSVGARIVRSPYIMGTTSVLLKILGKRAVKAYKGELG